MKRWAVNSQTDLHVCLCKDIWVAQTFIMATHHKIT